MLSGCVLLPKSVTRNKGAESLVNDYKSFQVKTTDRKVANIKIGENRLTPPNSGDIKTLKSALKVINENSRYPSLPRHDMDLKLTTNAFPRWVRVVFSEMIQVAFGEATVLGLVQCEKCLAKSDIESQVIALDIKIIIFLENNYDESEKKNHLRGLISHEISHYLISLYSDLYSPEHLTPLGFYDMAHRTYSKPSYNVPYRHAEVDLMANVLLKKYDLDSPSITEALSAVAAHIEQRTGEVSESLHSRIKVLDAFLK